MEIIEKTIHNQPIGKEALGAFVGGYLSGDVEKEEMTAFLRAVCAHGLSDEDAIALTEVMLESGDRLHFTPREYPYADKHSTGGVADSTTLIVAPIVAAAGIPFLKMSGRKLGHTGGTIDKLECFRGFEAELTVAEAEEVVDKVGAAIIAQTKELVPADKALYKLRDETNTVKSLPLIASSVVSKKLASGAEVFVLDVKTGDGAFMDTVEEGAKLARLMVRILKSAGKRAAAFLTDMNSPLGEGVGGVAEVLDAIDVLEGARGRLRELALRLAGKLISLAKGVSDEAGANEAKEILDSGNALLKLKEIVAAQGGSTELFSPDARRYILSRGAGTVLSEKDGFIGKIDCVKLGNLAREYEASGAYGMFVRVKVGDPVRKGDTFALLLGENAAPAALLTDLRSCFLVTDEAPPVTPLVYEIVT
ncbi:MAG: thymidine phosphorylase [Clostridia bacterium]|nr:thymidine phosphorylase [Clostridia bacterium]